jgi:hypothetical protein
MSDPGSPPLTAADALIAWSESDAMPLDDYGFATVREAVVAIEEAHAHALAAAADRERELVAALQAWLDAQPTYPMAGNGGSAHHSIVSQWLVDHDHWLNRGPEVVRKALAVPDAAGQREAER